MSTNVMALFRKSVDEGIGTDRGPQTVRIPDGWHRLGTLALVSLLALTLSAGPADAQHVVPTATYHLQVLDAARARVAVRATVPSDGAVLKMAESRPGDVSELADAGWPALVQDLRLTDADGLAVAVTSVSSTGWTLARSVSGPLTLEYEVDYAPLAARDWPAPREAAFADAGHLVVIGRSLFITTPAQRTSIVRFTVPRGWQAVTPWPTVRGTRQNTTVATTEDLSENLLVFLRGAPDVVTAGGFNLKIVTLGHWKPARAEVRRVLGVALQRLVALIGFDGHAEYLVVLLPQVDRGGEAFRASFALTLDAAPSRANLDDWGNLVAHEVFHYWNGWRLKGADYSSSQWFQEGLTEYAANLAMLSGELGPSDRFLTRLAAHVTKYRKLTTPLDARAPERVRRSIAAVRWSRSLGTR
ncbi:MAG: hypothetical protein IPG76_04245 [Acidobacteria bacterium]|nr:hypothetical protein [Acidobacteriota bacterium]